MLTSSDFQRLLVSGGGALLLSAAFVGAACLPAKAATPAGHFHQIAARVPPR